MIERLIRWLANVTYCSSCGAGGQSGTYCNACGKMLNP